MAAVVDSAICDALWLVVRTAELGELRGDPLSDVAAELERLWLESAYARFYRRRKPDQVGACACFG
jgi:hypothetical protein